MQNEELTNKNEKSLLEMTKKTINEKVKKPPHIAIFVVCFWKVLPIPFLRVEIENN